MRWATPRWWFERAEVPRPLIARLAAPLSAIWAAATRARIARGGSLDPGAPVICVGNLTLGGSGKTPVVREIARRLRARGANVHMLSRGHRGRLRGPAQVDVRRQSAADVGDEPLMLANDGPVWIAADRAAGALAAVRAGAAVVVMDDGHQNPSVRKALSLVVVDGETRGGEWPFGDGAVFPAGPMREPLRQGLERADAVIVLLPADLAAPDPELVGLFAGKPVLVARLETSAPPPTGPQLAFAGIAKPWRFEQALRVAGCVVADFVSLPDHAFLSSDFMSDLGRRATDLGAGLVTSEKDWVRLAPDWKVRVTAWPVRARFESEAALDDLLSPVLASVGPSGAGEDSELPGGLAERRDA